MLIFIFGSKTVFRIEYYNNLNNYAENINKKFGLCFCEREK